MPQPTRHGTPLEYAVVWRVGDGQPVAGRLELTENALALSGPGGTSDLRIGFDEVVSIEVGREKSERVNNAKAVVLHRLEGERVYVGAVGDAGMVGELADLLASLRAGHAARARVLVVFPLRADASEKARRLIEEGPPFDLERLALARHHVFVSEREIVFYFEGADAVAVVEALARDPRTLRAAAQWRSLLAGRPRLAREGFAWTRTDAQPPPDRS